MSLVLLSSNDGHSLLPSEEVIDQVFEACSEIDCENLLVQGVLSQCPRFAAGLNIFSEKQVARKELDYEIKRFMLIYHDQMPFSIIFAKPPETIALICQSPTNLVLFDPHSRSDFNGVAMTVYETVASVLERVNEIWPETPGISDFDGANIVHWLVVFPTNIPLHKLPELNQWQNHNKKETVNQDFLNCDANIGLDSQREKIQELTSKMELCQLEINDLKAQQVKCMSILKGLLDEFSISQRNSTENRRDTLKELRNVLREITVSSSSSTSPPVLIIDPDDNSIESKDSKV